MTRPARLRAAAAALLAAVLLVAFGAASATAATPRRIVALTPFTANTLMALDAKPIAVGQLPSGDSKISKRLRGVKRLTLSHTTGGPNLEEVALLNPDLVLSAPVWNNSAKAMRELGMNVVMSDPQHVSDIPRHTRYIGKVVGRTAKANAEAARQQRAIRSAMRKARRHPKVLVVLGVGRTLLSFMPDSWGGDLVMAAGGRLVTSEVSGGLSDLVDGFATLQAEKIIEADPDVIIAVPHGSPASMSKTIDFLKSSPAWRGTKAQRNGRIYVSTDNTLLQAWTTGAQSIYDVQTKYLRNR